MLNVNSDIWLREKDIDIDLRNEYNKNNLNPMAAIKVLNAVKRIINIVHGKNKYQVIFNGQEDTGYINYTKNKIVISTKMLKNPPKNYSLYDIIDILTGIALHESGHAEHSSKNLAMPELKHTIYNIIEDAVIEQLIAYDFPGYHNYFIKVRRHYFKKNVITKTNNTTCNIINDFLIGVRYVGKPNVIYPQVREAINIINDKLELPYQDLLKVDRIKLMEEIYIILFKSQMHQNKQKTNNNIIQPNITMDAPENDSGLSDNTNSAIQTIKEDQNDKEENDNQDDTNNIEEKNNKEENDNQNDVNDDNNEEENDNQDDINEDEKKNNDNGGNVNNEEEKNDDINEDIGLSELEGNIREFLDEQDSEKEYKLNGAESVSIKNLLEEEYEEVINRFNDDKGELTNFAVITSKPKTDIYHKNAYNEKLKLIKKHINYFRNKFSWANTNYKVNCYGLQSGQLDDDSLYSAKFNHNIFMNNLITTKGRTKNIDIAFMMDFSGSMRERLDRNFRRFEAARNLAILFIEALEPINSINTWAFAFQNFYSYERSKSIKNYTNSLSNQERTNMRLSCHLANLYSPLNKNKYAIMNTTPTGNTPEVECLEGIVEILKKHGKKDSKKVIVMMTDGSPGSNAFGMFDAEGLIKKRVKELEKKDYTLIHLALSKDANLGLYPNVVKWNSSKGYQGLIQGFLRTLEKTIK